ncbi:MAG: flagellar motor protein [Labilithrix sp.]|nr:flagellar motor protein [Labilithrix sp.]
MGGPIVGVVVAIALILVGNVIEGGHLVALLNAPAALIVIGGTAGAVMVQYPFSTLSGAMKAVAATFKKPGGAEQALLEELVDYANRARKDGILALEKVAEGAADPFLRKALMMAVDGADATTVTETMELAIGKEEEDGEDHAKALEAAGGYAPTIGIIGAVLGLIHVMSNLSDINAVGHGIASAFVATIYGVGIANIFCLPLGARIKLSVRSRVKSREMVLAGVLAIQAGMNPKLVRERLAEYLHGDSSAKKDASAGSPARAAA